VAASKEIDGILRTTLHPWVPGEVRELNMPIRTLDPTLQELLRGRYIAALGTENADGAIHLTAVWYLFESHSLFVATSSKTQKVRNVAARPKASLMVDSRKPGAERGVTADKLLQFVHEPQRMYRTTAAKCCIFVEELTFELNHLENVRGQRRSSAALN